MSHASVAARQWSPYQLAVFEAVEHGTGHLVVEALAGSGKTSTILEAVQRIPHGQKVLLCAFNTRIKDELQKRAPAGVEVLTLHGLGYRAVREAWGRCRVQEHRERELLRDLAPWSAGESRTAILKLVGLAKNTLAEGLPELEALAEATGLTQRIDEGQLVEVIDLADDILRRTSKRSAEISFDDMVWLPALYGWRTGDYDLVLVDETQDLCAAQIQLVLSAVREGGRIVAVGDRNQAIYGFRGADEHAIPRLIEELGAATLPLSICYRCPQAVVRLAQETVPAIEVAATAPEGVVDHLAEDAEQAAVPGDVILSRTNAPLVPLCLGFLRRGVPAVVAGRDVAKRIRGMIDRAEKERGSSIAEVLAWVDAWAAQQVRRLERKGLDAQVDEVRDMQETIAALLEGCADANAARARVDAIFSDETNGGARVTLSTVHKAKGLEWPTVYVLKKTFFKRRGPEESNLWYTAITRSQWRLVIVGAKETPARGAPSSNNNES